MSYGSDKTRIRLNSGGKIKISDGNSAFFYLGDIVSGVLDYKRESKKISLAQGLAFNKVGERSCDFKTVLAQSSKEEIDLSDLIEGVPYQVVINNGIVGGKYQVIVIPKALSVSSVKLDMKSGEHQVVDLEFSAEPVDTADGTFNMHDDFGWEDIIVNNMQSKNPFFVILESTSPL